MDWKSALFGRPAKLQAIPTMTPQQQTLISQLIGGLGSPLGLGLQNLQQMISGSPEALEAYKAPMMREFREQIVPGIAERFSGMGAGAQGSSAFGQQLGSAGAGLAEQLGLQKANLQQQGMGNLMSMLGLAQQPQFQWQQMPGSQGAVGSLLGGVGTAAGLGLGGAIPGLVGSAGRGLGGLLRLLFRYGGGGLRPGEMYSPVGGYQQA